MDEINNNRNNRNRFINPYNFISADQSPSRNINMEAEDAFQGGSDLHTGYFVCELTAKTPLAIPDVAVRKPDEEEEGHYYYPFYRLGKIPAIPGSSLRGVFRSVFETLTNSCMVTLKPEERITKRSIPNPNRPFLAGVLKRSDSGKWELYAAERIALVGDGETYSPLNDVDGRAAYRRYTIGRDEDDEKYLEDDNQDKLYYGDEVKIEHSGPGHEKTIRRQGNERRIEVWNDRSVSAIQKGTGTKCYLYLGEKIFNKHAESVFRIMEEEPLISGVGNNEEKIKNAIQSLEETLVMYRSSSINRNLGQSHFGYKGYERAKRNGVIPIWYQYEDSGNLYFSLASIGRISYQTTMRELSRHHEPCEDRKELCPACAVFGMIGKSDEKNLKNCRGMGSRVRVTDAVLSDDGPKEIKDKVTLQELGSPRTSYLPFYSTDGKNYDEEGAEIRGRKYYWHNPEAAEDETVYIAKADPRISKSKEKTKRNGTFELVRGTFTFKVYYDHLSDKQLKMLEWTLTLGGNDTLYMHKIGHGKPLGLGSAKVKILERKERECSSDGYRIDNVETIPQGEETIPELLDQGAWEKVKIISEYKEGSKALIHYPQVLESEGLRMEREREGFIYTENALAAHKWFSNNARYERRCLPDIEKAETEQLSMIEMRPNELKRNEKIMPQRRQNTTRR